MKFLLPFLVLLLLESILAFSGQLPTPDQQLKIAFVTGNDIKASYVTVESGAIYYRGRQGPNIYLLGHFS